MTEEMGEDNIFIFGMKVDEVEALRAKGFEFYFCFESLIRLYWSAIVGRQSSES